MWDFDCGSFDNFQSYQSRQINPDEGWMKYTIFLIREFQSYQSKQIKPDKWNTVEFLVNWYVSIVSIQTDQSRPLAVANSIRHSLSFNRINSDRSIPTSTNTTWQIRHRCRFNRINPDRSTPTGHWSHQLQRSYRVSIVSIQTDQYRQVKNRSIGRNSNSFNRINPNSSIPTEEMEQFASAGVPTFQSYQSKQINPDTKWPLLVL